MLSSTLVTIASELETEAGASTSANANESGYWKRIATAAETLIGASSVANDNTHGYQKRAATALESLAGTSGAEENANESGYRKRIAEALEVLSNSAGTGSYANRIRAASVALVGWKLNYSIALDFVLANKYRRYFEFETDITQLTSYAHSVAPTITPATGYLHETGDNVNLGFTNPAGDFTFVIDALGPASGAVYRLAAVLDGGGANPTDRIEFYRNNAGDIARIIVYNAGVTVVDTNLGTGTDVSNPVWGAGATMRLGIVRIGGVLRPYIGDALQSGSVTYTKSLTTLRIGHGWQAGAQVAPFESTIQRIFLIPSALSGAAIAALT